MENMNENEYGYNGNNKEEAVNNIDSGSTPVSGVGADVTEVYNSVVCEAATDGEALKEAAMNSAATNEAATDSAEVNDAAACEAVGKDIVMNSVVESKTIANEMSAGHAVLHEDTVKPAAAWEMAADEATAYEEESCRQSVFTNVDNTASEKKNKKERKHKERPVKEKKQHGFVYKAVRNTACAVLLGAVAGASCYGTMYAGYVNFPVKTSAENMSEDAVAAIAKEISENYITMGAIAQDINKNNISDSNLTNLSAANSQIQATVIDVSDIVSNVISSVVAISGTQTVTNNMFGFGLWGNYSQSYEAAVSGSGIIIGANDTELLVVTNAHVVDGVNNLKVNFCNDTAVDAVIKGMKSESDLAVVAIKLKDIDKDTMNAISVAKLGSSTDIEVGEAAIAIGNAAGYGISVTTGIVSAVDKSLTVDNVVYENLIQTDAAINPGNSGGALFNAQGEVIGINSVKMSDTSVEGMGYAISIESVRDIIDDLSTWTTRVALDDDERGYLGVTGKSVTADISSLYGWPQGVLIKSVSEDSAAEQAGLQVNDVIVSFDGKTIDSWETLVNTMQYYEVGETVEVIYYHLENGNFAEKTVSLTLTQRPDSGK